MRSGQRSYIPGIGPIRITSVEPVDVDALTDADAIPDGFPTAAALQTRAPHHLRRQARPRPPGVSHRVRVRDGVTR